MQDFVVLITTRIWQLAAINLMTVGLIILGLGFAGLAPALIASLWATCRLQDAPASVLLAGMWQQYKREWLTANLCVLPLLVLASALAALALYLGGIPGAVLLALSTLVCLQAFACLLVMANLSGTVSDAFANATTAMALAPYRIMLAVVLLPAIVLVSFWQPLAGFYFALSGWAMLATIIVKPGIESSFPTAAKPFSETEVQS